MQLFSALGNFDCPKKKMRICLVVVLTSFGVTIGSSLVKTSSRIEESALISRNKRSTEEELAAQAQHIQKCVNKCIVDEGLTAFNGTIASPICKLGVPCIVKCEDAQESAKWKKYCDDSEKARKCIQKCTKRTIEHTSDRSYICMPNSELNQLIPCYKKIYHRLPNDCLRTCNGLNLAHLNAAAKLGDPVFSQVLTVYCRGTECELDCASSLIESQCTPTENQNFAAVVRKYRAAEAELNILQQWKANRSWTYPEDCNAFFSVLKKPNLSLDDE